MASPVVPVSLDDTSPLVAYAPWGDPFGPPQLLAGWAPYYSLSGFAGDPAPSPSSAVTDVGNGTSLHLTAADGAQLAVAWNGTAITLYGTLAQAATSSAALAYSIALDGAATTDYISSLSPGATLASAPGDILAAFGTLADAPHQLVLTVHNPAGADAGGAALAFDRAALWMDASGSALPLSTTATYPPPPSPTVSTTVIPDTDFAYSGQWDYDASLLPGLPSAAFHTSTNVGDTAKLAFTGTAVTLSGLVTPSSGSYNVTLDNRTTTYSARASFTANAPTVLFYAADLHPSQTHELEIVNAGPLEGFSGADSGSLLVVLVNGANATTTTGSAGMSGATSSSSTLPRGTVAALAIGVTLAFISVCVLVAVAVWWRRHRTAQHKRNLIMHPRVHGGLRSLFRRGPRHTLPHDPEELGGERGMREKEKARDTTFGVPAPDPAQRYTYADDDDDDDFELADVPARARHPYAAAPAPLLVGHAAQNSDGSFSIDLPELSPGPEGLPRASFPSTARAPESPRTSPPGSSRPGTAGSTRPGTAGSTRPGTAGSTRPGTAGSTRPGTAGSARTSTRPRGPRQMTQRSGILRAHAPTPSSDADTTAAVEGFGAPSLRVEFAAEDRPERERERYVSAGAMSLPQSLRQALVRSAEVLRRLEAGEEVALGARPSALSSFLSLTASSGSSSRSRSMRSSASRSASTRSSRSRRSDRSEPSDPRASLGMTVRIEGGPTPSRPELTPEISLQTVPLPEPPESAASHDRSEVGTGGLMPSPTESYPHTLSDIHFRHSAYSTSSFGTAGPDSRRASAVRTSNSHRPPPHPPLPNTVPNTPTMPTHARTASQQRPYIVQKLMGMPIEGAEPLTPFGSPAPAASVSAPSGASTSAGPSGSSSAAGSAGPSGSGRVGTPSSLPGSPGLAQFVLGRKRT